MNEKTKEVRWSSEVCSIVEHILFMQFWTLWIRAFYYFLPSSNHFRNSYFHFIQISFGHYLIELYKDYLGTCRHRLPGWHYFFFVLDVNSVLCIACDIVNTIVSVIVSTIVNIVIIVMITMVMILSYSYYYCSLDHPGFLA